MAVDGYKRGMTDIDLAETLEMGTKCSEGSPQPLQNADTRGIGVSHSSEREERSAAQMEAFMEDSFNVGCNFGPRLAL